jgi:hypothetical protein
VIQISAPEVTPAPVPPKANKAVIAALIVVILVVRRAVTTDEFDFSAEGLDALLGAIGVLLVWLSSNFKSALGFGKTVLSRRGIAR